MTQHTHEFQLTGHSWEEKPSCWRNFVRHVMSVHDLHGIARYVVMDMIKLELSGLGLQRTDHTIVGSPEDLTAWMLTYA
jgi:hypothetical protein